MTAQPVPIYGPNREGESHSIPNRCSRLMVPDSLQDILRLPFALFAPLTHGKWFVLRTGGSGVHSS